MADDGDYAEEEVWETWKLATIKDGSPKSRRDKGTYSSSSSSRCPTSGARATARSNGEPDSTRQSAPLSIPDWSRVQRNRGSYNSSGKSFAGSDTINRDACDNQSEHGCGSAGGNEDDDDDDDEEDEEGRVPPHEWLAKKMSRSQISSFSVCEGAGRTLKGRDLRKVRNAVLTKTGFLE